MHSERNPFLAFLSPPDLLRTFLLDFDSDSETLFLWVSTDARMSSSAGHDKEGKPNPHADSSLEPGVEQDSRVRSESASQRISKLRSKGVVKEAFCLSSSPGQVSYDCDDCINS